MPQLISEENILKKLREKDISAYELVFKEFYPELCGFANKYLQDMDKAEELVQDLFCSLWEKIEDLSIQVSLKSYLYSSIRNSVFNHFKHKKVVDKYQQYASNKDAFSSHAGVQLEVKELQANIERAIGTLPDKCRKVFELSRIHHKKYQEIADELEISIKTVEVHMGKALRILRSELGPYLPIALLILTNYNLS